MGVPSDFEPLHEEDPFLGRFAYDAPSVSTLRSSVALPLALLALVGTACHGSASQVQPTTPPTSAPTSTSATPTVITPGAFRYMTPGLLVTLELKTNTGTMMVRNGSGEDLGKPGLYVFDQSGKRINGKVLAAAPIADGAKASFRVQFPSEVNDKTVGLVILLFGGDNFGAFAPA